MAFLKEVNLKYDMPTADLAVRRATWAIQNARTTGAGALKLIHGYGSHGVGGRIRVEVRAYLERQRSRGLVRDVIPGERFSIFDETRGGPSSAATSCGATRTSTAPTTASPSSCCSARSP